MINLIAFAIKLKETEAPDARHEIEMKELLASNRDFLIAKLEKSISDTEAAFRAGSGCWFYFLYKQHSSHLRMAGMQEIAIQMALNEQNPEMVLSSIRETASMYTLGELQDMMSRAVDLKTSGNFNLAVQLDTEELARAKELM